MKSLLRLLAFLLLGFGLEAGAQAVGTITLNAVLGSKAMLKIDGESVLLSPGETRNGVELIEARPDGATIRIGDERREIGFGASVSSRFSVPDTVETRVYPDSQGMYQAVGSINGFPVRFLLDTGATFVGLDAELARRIGLRYRLDGKREMVQTASGSATVYRMRLDSVRLGGITLRNVDAHVLDQHRLPEPLLGMSFLSRLQVRNEDGAMVLSHRP